MKNTVEIIRKRVKKSDLTGDIKTFPLEVVQKMCENQVEQGNRFNPEVFQLLRNSGKDTGGFNWNFTKEGDAFWRRIVLNKNFHLFFKEFNQ